MPGNAKYSDAVEFGRKTVILGTSMIKGIRRKEFNSYVKNGYSKIIPFLEQQLQLNAIPSLVDETPNRVILNGWYGVNKIFVSSLICKKNNYLNEKVTRIDFLIDLIGKEKGFLFIDHRNIIIDDLWEDGLHLKEQGKAKLARNFKHFLNNSH